jgi:hypothetical protein
MSGGPAFSVPVLDTQEFYQGILRPISGQIYDVYLQAGYPPDLLFNLFVKKVVMKRADCPAISHERGCEFTFDNYAGIDLQHQLFQALGDYLLALGMTTESTQPRAVAFNHPQNVNIRYVGAPGPNPSTAQVVAGPAGSAPAEAAASPKPYGFCFAPRTPADTDCVGGPMSPYICTEKHTRGATRNLKKASGPHGGFWPTDQLRTCRIAAGTHASAAAAIAFSTSFSVAKQDGSSKANIIASVEFIDKLAQIADDHPLKIDESEASLGETVSLSAELKEFSAKPVSVTFYLRSVESMIYYLGEVMRRQIAPEFELPRPIFVKWGSPYAPYPENLVCIAPGLNCELLFVLKEGGSSDADDVLSVDYGGRRFSVPRASASRSTGVFDSAGLSTAVLDILRQQIALNSSAKSLPQSSVISVVGQ